MSYRSILDIKTILNITGTLGLRKNTKRKKVMTWMMTTDKDQAAHIKIGTLMTDITPQKGIDTEIQLTMAEQVVKISQEGQDIDMMGMIGEGIKTEDEGMILEMTVIQIRIIIEDRQADKAIEND